ncbi:TPA: hypothetical protein JLS35_003144 [Escherichia coli]|nr:hypothetical protein [Escherichia coli]
MSQAFTALVFPAPAGINRAHVVRGRPSRRVPRASGDKPAREIWPFLRLKCSPRQRG